MVKSLLVKKTRDSIDMFFARDVKIPKNEWQMDNFLNLDMDSFMKNSKYNAVIEHYTKINNLSRTCILIAHGDFSEHQWTYSDSKDDYFMQSWINKNDGKYGSLIICSCNPGNASVSSEKSALIIPNEVYGRGKFSEGTVQLELYIPGLGYMESYDVDNYIKDNHLKI